MMFFILSVLFLGSQAIAQDIITLTSGTQIQSKVLDITPNEVKYKVYNNPDGPTNTILKSTVASIQYANGVRTLFNEATGDKPRSGKFVRGNKTEEYKSSGSKEYGKKKGHNGGMGGWYFGVNLDLGGSNIVSSDPAYITHAKFFAAENFLATCMFDQHFGIEFGIGDQGYNYSIDFNNYLGNPGTSTFNLSYFTIPVRAVYYSNTKEPVGFYAIAGIDFSILSDARDAAQESLTTFFSPTMISPYISCGVEFRTRHDRVVWQLGPYYKTSVGNIYTYDAVGLLTSGSSGTINSFGISLSTMRKYGRYRN